MPPSLVSPYTTRVGTQILLTDLHYPDRGFFLASIKGACQNVRLEVQWVFSIHNNRDDMSEKWMGSANILFIVFLYELF